MTTDEFMAKWGPRIACGTCWPADELEKDLDAVVAHAVEVNDGEHEHMQE